MRCILRTWLGRGMVVGFGACVATVAFAADPAQSPAREGAEAAPFVDWSHVKQAHRIVEQWVAAGGVDWGQTQQQPIQVSGVQGVRVTLRWQGVTLGVGDATIESAGAGPSSGGAPSATQPASTHQPASSGGVAASSRADGDAEALGKPVDLVQLAARAAADAIAAAGQSYLERSKGALDEQQKSPLSVPAGADGHLDLAQLGSRLLVDVQVARSFERVTVPASAGPGAVYARFVPGFHGLRMTRLQEPGAGDTAWMWPGSALAANTQPRSQLIQLLVKLGYDVDDLREVGRGRLVSLERFEVIHVVRVAGDQPPQVLMRGNRMIPLGGLDGGAVDELAGRIAAFLCKRAGADGRMAGTYHPSSDTYDPPVAPIQDMALAVYALARRDAYLSRRGRSGARADATAEAQALRRVAMYLVSGMLDPTASLQGDPQVAADAVTLMALVESPTLSELKDERDQLASRLLSLQQGDGWFRSGAGPQARRVSRPTQSLVVAALASLAERVRDVELARKVERSEAVLWQEAEAGGLVGLVPWVAMTEAHLARLGKLGAPDAQPTRSQRWDRLGELADALRQRQIIAAPQVGPADVVGGFELTPQPGAVAPSADWQSARVLAFLALALRQEELRQGRDAVQWLLDCGLAARFVAQLTFDPYGCYYVRSPADVLGGVRTALWDNRVPIGPSAMSLLAITELQETLESLGNMDRLVGQAGELQHAP